MQMTRCIAVHKMGAREDKTMPDTKSPDIRAAARELVDTLPPDATWDDVMYRIYVRQEIEAGLVDEREGRVVDQDEAERRLGVRSDEG